MAVGDLSCPKRAKGPRFLIRNPGALKALRQAAGLSEAALAALVGVSGTTISYWESGRFGADRGIRVARAVRLLRALHLDPQRPYAIGEYVGLAADVRLDRS